LFIFFGMAVTIGTICISLQVLHHATCNHVLHISIHKCLIQNFSEYVDRAGVHSWFYGKGKRMGAICTEHCKNVWMICNWSPQCPLKLVYMHVKSYGSDLAQFVRNIFDTWLICTLKFVHPPQQISFQRSLVLWSFMTITTSYPCSKCIHPMSTAIVLQCFKTHVLEMAKCKVGLCIELQCCDTCVSLCSYSCACASHAICIRCQLGMSKAWFGWYHSSFTFSVWIIFSWSASCGGQCHLRPAHPSNGWFLFIQPCATP